MTPWAIRGVNGEGPNDDWIYLEALKDGMADEATGEGMTNERRAQKWGRGPQRKSRKILRCNAEKRLNTAAV